MALGQLPADHHLIDGRCRRGVEPDRRQHRFNRQARAGQLGLHATGEIDGMPARLLALGKLDGNVTRAFRHAQVHRVDEREGDGGDDVEQRVPFARLALHGNGRIRHHVALDQHVVRTGAAHAERAPGVEHLHVRRVHRDAEVQHRGRLALGLVHGARHQQVAGRRAGGEDLACVDAIAAVDLLGLAGTGDPVRAAA
jgi:hypothetical protein